MINACLDHNQDYFIKGGINILPHLMDQNKRDSTLEEQ